MLDSAIGENLALRFSEMMATLSARQRAHKAEAVRRIGYQRRRLFWRGGGSGGDAGAGAGDAAGAGCAVGSGVVAFSFCCRSWARSRATPF
jgi:hypothetical protein